MSNESKRGSKYSSQGSEGNPAATTKEYVSAKTSNVSMKKVPKSIRHHDEEHRKGKKNYSPWVVALGPYHHHHHKELIINDEVKKKILERTEWKDIIHAKPMEILGHVIQDARKCYDYEIPEDELKNHGRIIPINQDRDESTKMKLVDKYDDEEFAKMMVLDGCLILYILECHHYESRYRRLLMTSRLGTVGVEALVHDMFLLENQVPFIVLWELMKKFINARWDKIFYRSLEYLVCGRKRIDNVEFGDKMMSKYDPNQSPSNAPLPAYNLLEIVWECFFTFDQNPSIQDDLETYIQPTDRSVMELHEKGLYVSKALNKHHPLNLNDIKVVHRCLSGRLQIPPLSVKERSESFFKNMILYEYFYKDQKNYVVGPYIHFMKMLIDEVEDVKYLKSRGIIMSSLNKDQEIVAIFNSMVVFSLTDNIFKNVEKEIVHHTKSHFKPQFAQLVHKYFSSYWNFIALCASIIVIFITCFDFVTSLRKK